MDIVQNYDLLKICLQNVVSRATLVCMEFCFTTLSKLHLQQLFTCSTASILSYKRLSNTDLLLMLWAAELLRKYLMTVFMANCAQICKLSVLGGRSLSDVVGGMVKFLLTVPMQRCYNWCGLKGKTKFGDLGIAGVLCSKCDNILLMIAIVQVISYCCCMLI